MPNYTISNTKVADMPHLITIYSPHIKDTRVLLSAFAGWIKSGRIQLHGMLVDLSTRDIGSELLEETSQKVESTINTNITLQKYDLVSALNGSQNIPNSLPLLVTFEDTYCGRLRFDLSDGSNTFSNMDSIIIIADPKDNDKKREIIDTISNKLDKKTPIVFALVSDKAYGDDSGAQSVLFNSFKELQEILKGRTYNTFWYNQYGFIDNNKLRPANDPSPVGIPGIFWDCAKKSAECRSQRNMDIIEECQTLITERRSVHQKKSVRRQLELNMARQRYAHSVVKLYSSDNLIALCRGTLQSNARTNIEQ